jgi:hypothetical protein
MPTPVGVVSLLASITGGIAGRKRRDGLDMRRYDELDTAGHDIE